MSAEQHTAATWRADQRLPERDEASLGLAGAERDPHPAHNAPAQWPWSGFPPIRCDPATSSPSTCRRRGTVSSRSTRAMPAAPSWAGQSSPRLREIPEHVDIVDIFRKPSDVPAVVDDAVAIGAGAVWMQLGVISAEAAAAGAGRGPGGGDGPLHESGARPPPWTDAHHGLRDRHHLGPPPHSRRLDGRTRPAPAPQP